MNVDCGNRLKAAETLGLANKEFKNNSIIELNTSPQAARYIFAPKIYSVATTGNLTLACDLSQ
jgi:hypothetical protein